MSTFTATAPSFVTLDLLRELLGCTEDTSPDRLLFQARAASYTMPSLLLAVAEHEGWALGSGSRDEVHRHRARIGVYRDLADELADEGVTVMKGPALAAYYPAWFVRTSGDLDLVVPDETTLWRLARRVCELVPVHDRDLSLLGDDGNRHLMVSLRAPAADPWLEPELRVEISTYAFAGDFGAVPLRAGLPAERPVADLLTIAEERFQRSFTARDLLDCTAVLIAAAPDPAVLAAAAARWHLAPELLELLERTSAVAALAELVDGEYLAAVREPARAARAARAAAAPVADPAETAAERLRRRLLSGGTVTERLATGLPVFGMPVPGPAPRPAPADRAELHRLPSAEVLTTPIGAFLLAAGELVQPDQYETAVVFAREWEATPCP
jgi:hypothetical protein